VEEREPITERGARREREGKYNIYTTYMLETTIDFSGG
jgi:hypothetical protein